jgi:hypothetical protein
MKTKILLATLMAAALIACDSTSSNDTTNDNGGGNNTIGLSGSLLDPSGKGIPNAKVLLKSTGAVAITDANGKWAITSTPDARATAARALAETDSIVVSKDSQNFSSLSQLSLSAFDRLLNLSGHDSSFRETRTLDFVKICSQICLVRVF